MFLLFILFAFSVFVLIKSASYKKQEPKKKTEGEVLKNKYIIEHEKKLENDAEYEEYLEWCKIKGELPAEKGGYDEYQMKEYQMYKKLQKHGIKGLLK